MINTITLDAMALRMNMFVIVLLHCLADDSEAGPKNRKYHQKVSRKVRIWILRLFSRCLLQNQAVDTTN